MTVQRAASPLRACACSGVRKLMDAIAHATPCAAMNFVPTVTAHAPTGVPSVCLLGKASRSSALCAAPNLFLGLGLLARLQIHMHQCHRPLGYTIPSIWLACSGTSSTAAPVAAIQLSCCNCPLNAFQTHLEASWASALHQGIGHTNKVGLWAGPAGRQCTPTHVRCTCSTPPCLSHTSGSC